jgi:hypothetical protein
MQKATDNHANDGANIGRKSTNPWLEYDCLDGSFMISFLEIQRHQLQQFLCDGMIGIFRSLYIRRSQSDIRH